MLWVTDPNGALSFISRGWFEHTGQREEEAYAEGAGWTRMLHPDDRAPAAKAFEQAAQRREPFELEYRLRRADGSYRWAMDAGRPRWAVDGSWLGYIGSVIDVHDRTEAREGLREADRRKDEFLATLAHELRNPLAPIRNALQLLARGDSRSPTERVHAMLDRQVTHMVRLVDDLMEASRISRGQLELKREVLDLAEVLRAALEISRPLVERGRHDLHMALADEPLPVDGDGVRLAQVFSNLLNNAAKYTDDGGRIEIEARREGASVHVSIRDNGIGIAADQLPRLFEMFAQIDPTQARRHGGLGIGLSLAQRLVQMHGGTLQAASEGRGRGSVFSVRLPLAPGSAAPAPRPAVAGDVKLGRVLVVDDNVDAADTLGMLLRLLGAEVRVEHDGAMALRAAQEWQPAVVLLDLGMPGMDGFEVARRLRAESRLPRPTLIALTGWGQADVRRRTSLEGFDHHLIKPVDVDELHALLASLHDDAPTRVVPG
jgi:PAS domain S-box-containing protein